MKTERGSSPCWTTQKVLAFRTFRFCLERFGHVFWFLELLIRNEPHAELQNISLTNSRTTEPSWIKEEPEEPEPPAVHRRHDAGGLKEEAGLLDMNRKLVIKLHRIGMWGKVELWRVRDLDQSRT